MVLQVTHLTKTYLNQQNKLTVIDRLSFEIATGEFVCIVGPSGCGKTTLLRLLAGLHPPDKGEIRLNDALLTSPSSEIGLVFQKANLMPWRTVFDNVMLPLQVKHLPDDEAKQRVIQALKLVGLSDFNDSYPHHLSGGMEQRVAIARALVHKPKILMLDEPFRALDALSREKLNQEFLQVWQAEQSTILMVTHDIQEAVYLADRVLVLSQRPARLARDIPITLPRPRQPAIQYTSDFGALTYEVRHAIR
jgi:NitT/TauT family transport system ATP-binding protein